MKESNKFKLKAPIREEADLGFIEEGENTQVWLEKEFSKTESKSSKRKAKQKESKDKSNSGIKVSKSSITSNISLKKEEHSNGKINKQKSIGVEVNSNTIGPILDNDTYKIIDDYNTLYNETENDEMNLYIINALNDNAKNDRNISENSYVLTEEVENDGSDFDNNNNNDLNQQTENLEENLTDDPKLKKEIKKKKKKKKKKKDKENAEGDEGKNDKKVKKGKKRKGERKKEDKEILSPNFKQSQGEEPIFDSSASQISSIKKDCVDFTTSQNNGNAELLHNLNRERSQTDESESSINNNNDLNIANNEINGSQGKYGLTKKNVDNIELMYNLEEKKNEAENNRSPIKDNIVHPNIEQSKPIEPTPDNSSVDESLSKGITHYALEESSGTNSNNNIPIQDSQQKKNREFSNSTDSSKSKRIKANNNILDESFLQSLKSNNEISLNPTSSNISNSILDQSNQSDPSKLSTILNETEKCMYILNKLLSNPLISCILKNENNGFGEIENKIRNQNYNNVQEMAKEMRELIKTTKRETIENNDNTIYPSECFHLLYEKLESYLEYFNTSSELPDNNLITLPWSKFNSIENIKYTSDKEVCYIRIGEYEAIRVKVHSFEHQHSDLHMPIFLLLEEFIKDGQYFINNDTIIKLFIIQNKHYYSTSNTNLIYLVDVTYSNKRYILKVAPLLNPQLIDNGADLNLDKPKSWIYLKVFDAMELTSLFTSFIQIPFLKPIIYKNFGTKSGSCIREVLRSLDT